MIIGCPKEIKTREYRVGLVPGGAAALTGRGHQVLIEKGAGLGSGVPDAAYEAAGAKIVEKAADVWSRAEMIVKVKEPVASEYGLMREGQTVYTYFHLAADRPLTKALLERKVTAVAYETIQTDDGQLPLLKPMSEVAGRMAVQVGAVQLEKGHGGKGVLLSGVPGVRRQHDAAGDPAVSQCQHTASNDENIRQRHPQSLNGGRNEKTAASARPARRQAAAPCQKPNNEATARSGHGAPQPGVSLRSPP